MAKVTAPLASIGASGSVHGTLTFSQRKSGQQVRFQKKQKDYVNDARQAARANYSAAVAAWRAMTTEEKAVYFTRAENMPMTGYNLFVKESRLALGL